MIKRFAQISAVVVLALLMALFVVGMASAKFGVAFSQCANNLGVGPCNWINGIIQANNSVYYEGDGVPQKAIFDNLDDEVGKHPTHTLKIEWDTTKGGVHAYDYLVSVDSSETYVNQTELCVNAPAGCSGWAKNTFPIPNPGLTITEQAGNFTILNGAIIAVGPYVNSGSMTGDSSASITITFVASGPDVVIAWGGHLAKESDWGTGLGAGSISGGPFHQNLVSLNGSSTGSKDNQIQPGVIPSAIALFKFGVAESKANPALLITVFAALLASLVLFRRYAGARAG